MQYKGPQVECLPAALVLPFGKQRTYHSSPLAFTMLVSVSLHRVCDSRGRNGLRYTPTFKFSFALHIAFVHASLRSGVSALPANISEDIFYSDTIRMFYPYQATMKVS